MKYLKEALRTVLIVVAIYSVIFGVFLVRNRPIIAVEAPLEYPERYYSEVEYMLANDSVMAILNFWNIDTITYYDWEETAFSLGMSTDLLTIEMFLDHLQLELNPGYRDSGHFTITPK